MGWLSDGGTGTGLVSCDWLALSCMLGSPRGDRLLDVPRGWQVVPMGNTAVWADRFYILDDLGNKVATVLCTPRSPKIDACRCLVEVANRYLYADEFHAVTDRVLECLPMVVTGINRVDLCCDFEMTDKLYETLEGLASGKAYVKSLGMGSVWWQMIETPRGDNRRERVPHCLTFGGKESIFKWKVYYKWLELFQAPPEKKKPYITDMWKAAGFNERYVWRCEVSVNNTNRLAGTTGKAVPLWDWYDNRAQLFSDLYTDKFIVRLDQGHRDKRNDKRVPFLEPCGMKSIYHAKPQSEGADSDAERRVTCKLWAECQQVDVQANKVLLKNLCLTLCELLQKPSNVWAIRHVYGIETQRIVEFIESNC